MNTISIWLRTSILLALGASASAQESNGLAPEVTDLNAADVSYALEAKLPDLKKPFLDTTPTNRNDGIQVGELGVDGGDKGAILAFAADIAAGKHGEIDSLLLYQNGKLLFESYYRRGRINYPHYQMSITKSYTALALGRAISLGYLAMADLDKPAVSFLKELDPDRFVDGAEAITLAEAMNMHSGIRIDDTTARRLRRTPELLIGQRQVQAYFENSKPIPPSPRSYKYQGSDPSITMQVVEAVVPGTAREFIKTELLDELGITNFAWQDDLSGLPKSAAGSSFCSRDMLKWGMLVMNRGKWKDQQIIPAEFIKRATSPIYTNKQSTSYGYFWWRHDMEAGDRSIDCISGRGAGGQYLFVFPELKLIAVITAHNKGMGPTLKITPARLLPAFISHARCRRT